MSKKIASGSKNLVLDIKVGEGALIKNIDDARMLANLMIKIGNANDMRVACLLTNMDVPLGNNVGNALEVIEALNVLYYNPESKLKDLCIELASYMVYLGLKIDYDDAKRRVIEVLENKNAYNKLLQFIQYQQGDISKLSINGNAYEIKANKDGYLEKISSLEIAKLSSMLGSGRMNKDDSIDYSAGIVINKNIGTPVKEGDVVMTLYTNKEIPNIDINKLFTIGSNSNTEYKLIYEIIE